MHKKLLLISVILSSLCLLGCRTNRVYVEAYLFETAQTSYGFTEFYCFKIIDIDTARELTGKDYANSGIIIGRRDNATLFLFVPKKTDQDLFVLPFCYHFSFEDMIDELNSLEDDEGNPLYVDPSGDYGGLSIGVGEVEMLLQNNPGLDLDSRIIFTFTTDEAVFHIASVGDLCRIFSGEYILLN